MHAREATRSPQFPVKSSILQNASFAIAVLDEIWTFSIEHLNKTVGNVHCASFRFFSKDISPGGIECVQNKSKAQYANLILNHLRTIYTNLLSLRCNDNDLAIGRNSSLT